VVLSLTVTNRGLSTAFDVVVTDLVSTVWFDTTTLAPVSVPAGFTYAASGAPGDATVTFASDPLSGQPANSIEVGESLVFQFSALLIPGASGRITNTAVVATNTTTDGPNPDERVEPRHQQHGRPEPAQLHRHQDADQSAGPPGRRGRGGDLPPDRDQYGAVGFLQRVPHRHL
jgi:hypothetical protein